MSNAGGAFLLNLWNDALLFCQISQFLLQWCVEQCFALASLCSCQKVFFWMPGKRQQGETSQTAAHREKFNRGRFLSFSILSPCWAEKSFDRLYVGVFWKPVGNNTFFLLFGLFSPQFTIFLLQLQQKPLYMTDQHIDIHNYDIRGEL